MTSFLKHPYAFGCIAAALIILCLLVWWMKPARPNILGLSIYSHPSVPTVKQLKLGERSVVSRSTRGRNETGGATYSSRRGDALDFELAWYDILNKQAYALSFSIPAAELSTFGDANDHASIRIEVGPGADVIVTTPNPEELRQIGLTKTIDLAAPHKPALTLRELCAQNLTPDNAVTIDLAAAVEDWSLNAAMKKRDQYLQKQNEPKPRCLKN